MKTHLLLITLVLATSVSAHTVRYVSDNTNNFPNPERGFFYGAGWDVCDTSTVSMLTDAQFTADAGHSLVQMVYTLVGFRNDSLSTTVLQLFDNDFAKIRQHGYKCILRFSYTYSEDERVDGKYADASPRIWKKHLEQLKPILHANADVIACVQAGFLGVWGEWYYTAVGRDSLQLVKNNLINQLLDAVPQSRTIQLRTPAYKQAYIGDTIPLSSEEAFTGTPRARLAHHNDAFLYQADNMGTYQNRKKEMYYLSRECLYLPIGGESDVYNQPVYDRWATGEQAKEEMAYLHYSFLNQGYHQLVISNWRSEGVFDEIAMKLGYRFQLDSTRIAVSAIKGNPLDIHLSLRNVGYAPLYNERQAYIVLRSSDTTCIFPLATDPRRWLPNGALTEINETITLPQDMPDGTYEVCLWMPDKAENLRHDPRYAIRLATDRVWEPQTGYNNLRTNVIVGTTLQPEPIADDPQPQPNVQAVTHLQGFAGVNHALLKWTNPPYGIIRHTQTVDLSQGFADVSYDGPSAQVTYANNQTTVNYTTTDNWQWAGVQYPVSQFIPGSQVYFEYQGNRQGVAMVVYAYDGLNRWSNSPYAYMLSSSIWLQDHYTPASILWTPAPDYAFGDHPITHLSFVANPATAQSGSFAIRKVTIVKEEDLPSDFAGVQLVRKQGSAPTSPSDGETVYYGRDSMFVDTHVEYGQTYYYAAYAFNQQDEIALPAICAVTIDGSEAPVVHRTTPSAEKQLLHGQIRILRNGKVYNLMGF